MMPDDADLCGASAAEALRLRCARILGLAMEVRLLVHCTARGDRFAIAAARLVVEQTRALYPGARISFDEVEV